MEKGKRLIDAKDFDLRVSQKKMSEVFPNWNELLKEVQDAVCKHAQHLHMLLETQPTIDAVEVVHGRWIGTQYDGYADGYPVYDLWECSECREEYESEGDPPSYNYCPNCGAKMG